MSQTDQIPGAPPSPALAATGTGTGIADAVRTADAVPTSDAVPTAGTGRFQAGNKAALLVIACIAQFMVVLDRSK